MNEGREGKGKGREIMHKDCLAFHAPSLCMYIYMDGACCESPLQAVVIATTARAREPHVSSDYRQREPR